jgi:hypothetical protein
MDKNNKNNREKTTIMGRTTTTMGRMMTTMGRMTTKITTRAKRTGTSHPNELTLQKMTERQQQRGPHSYSHHHHHHCPQLLPQATAHGVKMGSNGEGDRTTSRQ